MIVVPGKSLRVVSPDDKPAKKLSITEAAEAGELRALLVGMQSRVATAVQNPETPARDLAALTKRLMEIAREIKALDAEDENEAGGGEAHGRVDTSFDASAV